MFELLGRAEDLPIHFWWLELCVVLSIGLIFGSFASAIIYRVPRGLSWAASGGRSKCTSCQKVLSPLDLIPVLSWLINKGRCRQCGAPVSSLYPFLEAVCSFLCVLVFLLFTGDVYAQYLLIISVPFLLSLSVIDLQYKILPNQLVAILAVIGGIYVVVKILSGENAEAVLWSHIGGALLFFILAFLLEVVMRKALGKEALGMGDVKFFAVAGLWLGGGYLGAFCILAGVLGCVLGVLWKYRFGQATFPFGPALIASFFLILLLDGSFFFEKTLQYFQLVLPS